DRSGDPLANLPALDELDRPQGRRRLDLDDDTATAGREEAPALPARRDARAHRVHDRQERAFEEVERRSQRVVRAPLDDDSTRTARREPWGEGGLGHAGR